jgi:enoyl-CoA hydratase
MIRLKKQNHIAILTIDRPPLNVLNTETVRELLSKLEEFEGDPEVRAVVLTGAGKAFVAGGDIKEMEPMTPLEGAEYSKLGHKLTRCIEHLRVPIIAAVNGYALGGGCELMMACDLVIASSKARIGQPEIDLGITPGFGGTQRLPRLVGIARGKEMLYTGRQVSAEEALQIGLVTRVVEGEKLMDEVIKLAEGLASKAPVALRMMKELVNSGMNIDLRSACELETSMFSSLFATQDQKEGMKAFSERRKPKYKGK